MKAQDWPHNGRRTPPGEWVAAHATTLSGSLRRWLGTTISFHCKTWRTGSARVGAVDPRDGSLLVPARAARRPALVSDPGRHARHDLEALPRMASAGR